MASICNDERGRFGVVSGHDRKTLSLSEGGDGEPVDFAPLRMAVGELVTWFPQHAQTMDAALVQHLESVGFDPATGECQQPVPAEADAISGCGVGHCG